LGVDAPLAFAGFATLRERAAFAGFTALRYACASAERRRSVEQDAHASDASSPFAGFATLRERAAFAGFAALRYACASAERRRPVEQDAHSGGPSHFGLVAAGCRVDASADASLGLCTAEGRGPIRHYPTSKSRALCPADGRLPCCTRLGSRTTLCDDPGSTGIVRMTIALAPAADGRGQADHER